MLPIDLTVPLDWNSPVSPGHTRFSLKPIKRIARGDSSDVATLPPRLRGGTTGRGGTNAIEGCVPLRTVGADGAPPRVVLRMS